MAGTFPVGPWLAPSRRAGHDLPPREPAAQAFHATMPGYAPTPLVPLPALARELGVRAVLVKDESSRLGLPAFKILGVSWGTNRALATRAGVSPPQSFGDLARLAHALRPLEMVTATDGNHGRALARIASLLGLTSCVFVPDDLTGAAIHAIEAEGARVTRIEGTYDDAVQLAARHAAESPERLLLQDTAWPGYKSIPQWIVEGYGTLFREVSDQVEAAGMAPPTLVAVPAGVGSLLQAGIAWAAHLPDRPAVLSVEPTAAACVLASVHAGERVTIATGKTVMAGLNCGVPSLLAWPVIETGLDAAVAVSDNDARRAMADLRALGVDAGPCGAAALAGVRAVTRWQAAPAALARLGLHPEATIVLISTDGRTSVVQ